MESVLNERRTSEKHYRVILPDNLIYIIFPNSTCLFFFFFPTFQLLTSSKLIARVGSGIHGSAGSFKKLQVTHAFLLTGSPSCVCALHTQRGWHPSFHKLCHHRNKSALSKLSVLTSEPRIVPGTFPHPPFPPFKFSSFHTDKLNLITHKILHKI